MKLLRRKEKVQQEKKSYLFPDAMLYGEYKVSVMEKIVVFIIGFLVGYAAGYIFYELLPVSLIAGVIVGTVMVPKYGQMKIDKQKSAIKNQFKSLLESLSFSLSAGKTVIDSFVGAKEDLLIQYSEDDYIVKEIDNIIVGLNNNFNIEDMLFDLAERSESEDIKNFANVFDTCYRKGGQIKEVILSTYRLINDKMEINMEIESMVASSKMEQNMMSVMPVFFVFILNTMGSEITGKGTPLGYISTTVALALFAIAHLVGKKVLSIKM